MKSSEVLCPGKIDEILSFTDASNDVFVKETEQRVDIVQRNLDDICNAKHYSYFFYCEQHQAEI